MRNRAAQALQGIAGAALDGTKRTTVRNGVAIMSINGPLSKDPSWWMGGNDYETLLKDFMSAMDSAEVGAVVMDADSPGGEAFGCGEFAKAIFDQRGRKPIKLYGSGMVCSAMYWIGSACDEMIVDPSSMIGSIGVRSYLVDVSKMLANIGIEEWDILSDQSPNKVIDPSKQADRDRLQATMTSMASVFIADVARNRSMPSARVITAGNRGDVLIGREAVSAGLADRLGDFESLMAELTGRSNTLRSTARRGKSMAIKAGMKNAKCDGCDRDMDDDDDLYCAACHGSGAHVDIAPLTALTGKASLAESIAVVQGWKIAASEVATLRASMEQQKAAAEATQFDTELAAAKVSALLAPSDEHKRNKAALAFKGKPGAIESLRSFLSALDPLVGNAAATSVREPAATVTAGVTDEEKRIAKKLNIPLEAVQKNKARLMALRAVSGDDEDDNEDEDAA